ncbi:MAG: zinc-dependent metalloprotease [Actinomycetota bacterium]
MTTAVDWELAERVAIRWSGREPFSESYHSDRLVSDFAEASEIAEPLVAETTGLTSAGPARAEVISREDWIRVNIRSFQRLLAPLTDKLGDQLGASRMAPVARRVAGLEVGVVLGWMSQRVLGQYDLLVVDDDDAEGDVVYYVGPNVLALEKRWGFPPGEFRLWLALHELTHRAQFTGVPWMRDHFLSMVHGLLDEVDTDPDQFATTLKRIVEDRRSAKDKVAEGGLGAMFASDEQREVMDRIAGMMSLLEGHGDVTMTRAGGDLIPSSDRFHRVLHERRKQTNRRSKLIQRLIGLEAKLAQYEQGERFIEAVEAVGGPRVIDLAWQSPDSLPTISEIREPDLWIDRMGLVQAAAS